jgi:hypothetical protein
MMEAQRTHVLDWLERFDRTPYEGEPPLPRWARARGISKSEPALNRGGGRLTPSIVRDIKIALQAERPTAALAKRFGVTQSTISKIATRQTWAEVEI